MESNLTAVEWYSDKLLQILGESVNNFSTEQTMANHYALKQAKEIEKKQIIEAYEDGYSDSDNTFKLNEQYYNDKFKK